MRSIRSAGFTLVELLVVIAILGILIGLLMSTVQQVRESSRRTTCANNLRQLGVAVGSYRSKHRAYPPGRFRNNTHRWSQHARLLPYFGEANVHTRIDFEKSPGSEVNREARTKHIALFRCPTDGNRMILPYKKNHYGWGKNNYKGNAGNDVGTTKNGVEQNNGIFLTNYVVREFEVTDGVEYTALFAEAVLGDADDRQVDIPGDWFRISESHKTRQAVYNACMNVEPQYGAANQICRSGRNWVWGNYIPTRYNHIMPPNTKSCARRNRTNGDLDAGVNDKGGATTASSRHSGGINMVLCSGGTRFIDENIDREAWWALGSRNGEDSTRGAF